MTDQTGQVDMQQAQPTTRRPPKREAWCDLQSRTRNFLIPYADRIENHPVYHMELRRQRGDRTLATLLRYSATRLAIIGGVLVTIWLMVFITEMATSRDAWGYIETSTSDAILMWLIYIGLGASILLDFSAMIASVGVINRDRTTATWTLLRVSAIRRFDVIVVKHTVAQMRVWRMVAIIGSVRVATIVILLLYLLGQPLWQEGIGPLLEELVRALWEQPLEALLSVYILATAALVYIAELLWRVRGVTAMGTTVSARVRETTASLLTGFGGITAMWISQAMVAGGLVWFTGFVAEGIDPVDDLGVLVMLAAFTTLYAVVIYGYYAGLRAWCLRQATRHAFRE
jgi:hypothetical protein